MRDLHSKCLVGSTVAHALLCLVLLLGSAFGNKPTKVEPVTLLNFIPARAIDAALANPGGGQPQPLPPATPVVQPPPPAVQREPEPTPPVTKPQPEREREPEPEQPKPPEPKPNPEPLKQKEVEPPPEIKPDPVKNKPDFTLVERKNPKETTKQAKNTSKVSNTITNKPRISLDNPTVRTGPSKAAREAAAARERAAREAAERQKAINEGLAAITGTIRGNAAPATSVAGIGGGGGTGESYADYNSIIYSTYFHAWRPPEEVTDLEATVKVKIVIARDGSVISHSVQSRSGTPALDKSVEGALRRVHRIVPFPESWTDSQKTFLLNFNLKSKNRLG